MVSSRSPGVSVTCSNGSTSAEVPNSNDLIGNNSSTEGSVYIPRNDNEQERDLNNERPGWSSESCPPSLSMSIDLHHATSGLHGSRSFSASPERDNATSFSVEVTGSHEAEERYEGFGSVQGDCEEETESPGGSSSSAPSPTGPSSLRNPRSPNSTIGRHSWLRTSLRRIPSGTNRKRLSSNALASQLYRSSSFNSSGRGSICDTVDDMYSDVSLEDDVIDLNHRNPHSVAIGARTAESRKRDAHQNCPAEFLCCNNGVIEPKPLTEDELPQTSSPEPLMSRPFSLDQGRRTQIKTISAETSYNKIPKSEEASSHKKKKSSGTFMTDDEKITFLKSHEN